MNAEMAIPAQTAEAGGRPALLLPLRQLVQLSIYWFGINAIWGAVDGVILQARMESFVGAGSAGLAMAIAKLGGVIVSSNDPTLPPGMFAWFQVFDNGEGAAAPADRSSLVGCGTEAANEAFCNSPNLPRFGPWDVQGNAQVRG